MREWILGAAAHPAVAAAALAAGVLGIIAEFLLPARVLPGVLGGLLALLGLWSLLPDHAGVAVLVMLPLGFIALLLLRIAVRARRNKSAK